MKDSGCGGATLTHTFPSHSSFIGWWKPSPPPRPRQPHLHNTLLTPLLSSSITAGSSSRSSSFCLGLSAPLRGSPQKIHFTPSFLFFSFSSRSTFISFFSPPSLPPDFSNLILPSRPLVAGRSDSQDLLVRHPFTDSGCLTFLPSSLLSPPYQPSPSSSSSFTPSSSSFSPLSISTLLYLLFLFPSSFLSSPSAHFLSFICLLHFLLL